MCELLQSPELVLLLLPQKHQSFCSYDMRLAYAPFTPPLSECRILDEWSFSQRKPVGIQYCGRVGKLGKLDALGGIPKLMVRARVETYKDRWQIHINDPKILNLELTITLALFFFFFSLLLPPTWDCKSICFFQILSSPMILLTQHISIAMWWDSAELSAVLLVYSHHIHTCYPGSVTEVSHSSNIYARRRHWNYHLWAHRW